MENGRWSQGRIYLFWSILAYYVTLGILTITGMTRKANIDMNNFKIIIDALEYSMTLFAGYVLGNRFLEIFKVLKSNKKDE